MVVLRLLKSPMLYLPAMRYPVFSALNPSSTSIWHSHVEAVFAVLVVAVGEVVVMVVLVVVVVVTTGVGFVGISCPGGWHSFRWSRMGSQSRSPPPQVQQASEAV